MSKFRILHVACYSTNIGDAANISGIRRNLRSAFGDETEFVSEDLIQYSEFLGPKRFGEEFIRRANECDLVVLGGGGLFSANQKQAETGCYIGLLPDMIRKIERPVVIYAMGYAAYYDQPEPNRSVFMKYFSELAALDNVLIGLRNDGSLARLKALFGTSLPSGIEVVPDGGFFLDRDANLSSSLFPQNGPLIALQLAGDKLAYRFKDHLSLPQRIAAKCGLYGARHPQPHLDLFMRNYVDAVVKVHKQTGAGLVVVPHIPADLDMVNRFAALLPRSLSRLNFAVGPVVSASTGFGAVFDIYAQADLAIGMRFHSNVCSVGLGTPSIGLDTHPQIPGLYRELGIPERCLNPRTATFADSLVELVGESLTHASDIRTLYGTINDQLVSSSAAFCARIREKLSR